MSKATKRKHVAKEVLEDFTLPRNDQSIVKVVSPRGNNLHEVITPNGEKYLVSMPTKFRKNVWIKRGDFVMVDAIEEGDKVKAEIIAILYKEQIKHIKSEGLWPANFDDKVDDKQQEMIPQDMLPPSDESDYDSDQEDVINVNRQCITVDDDDDDSDIESNDNLS
ncbi:putative RNA-binding protein EIF1AD [Tubulanus polymorphus]|uniref:putative RNA-binding protein EIF1AD n=1 Tax=Tubulanus polymorphus TaxID=672921 RepID=UPI003DA5EBFC